MATESNMKTLFDTRTLKQEAWLKCKDSLVNLVKQFCFISTDDDEAEFSPSQEEELFKDKNAAGIVIVQDVTKDSAKDGAGKPAAPDVTTTIKSHEITHTEEKSFKRSKCDNKFKTEDFTMHDDEAEFRPSQQEEFFKDKNSAGNVAAQDMTKDSAKDYAGEPAAPDVTTITSLEIAHTEEKPFKYSECDNKFVTEDFSTNADGYVTAQDVTKEITKVNVSFSGCAFLGPYEVGSLKCFQDHIEGRFLNGEPSHLAVNQCLGASAGALMAACLILEYPALKLLEQFTNVIENANAFTLGPLNKNCHLNQLLRNELEIIFEEDAHLKVSGKLHISMTDLSGQNHIVSQFKSRNQLIEAILVSCYVPGLYAYSYFPQYNGQYFIDGGFSNNQPVVNSTIRVSPFAGPSEICPKDTHPSGRKIYYPEEMNLSMANLFRGLVAFSFKKEDPQSLYEQGYQDTEDFINSGQINNQVLKSSPSKMKPKKVRIIGIIITIIKLMYSLYKFISSLYKSCSNNLCIVPILLLHVLFL